MNITELERAAYAAGDTYTADLLARIDELLQRVDEAEKLLDEVLEYVEDGEPPSPLGDWAKQTCKFLAAKK
jgi:alpha-galactosidase/6-phospho-beta-glucosidase family protein